MVGSLCRVGMKGLQDIYGLRSCRCLLWEVFSQDTLDYVFWKISLDADKFNSINNLEIYTPSCMYIIFSLLFLAGVRDLKLVKLASVISEDGR